MQFRAFDHGLFFFPFKYLSNQRRICFSLSMRRSVRPPRDRPCGSSGKRTSNNGSKKVFVVGPVGLGQGGIGFEGAAGEEVFEFIVDFSRGVSVAFEAVSPDEGAWSPRSNVSRSDRVRNGNPSFR